MRKLITCLFLVSFFTVFTAGATWANEAQSTIPERDAKMGPAYEPGGLTLAKMGPGYEPGGLTLASEPYSKIPGRDAKMGPGFEPGG